MAMQKLSTIKLERVHYVPKSLEPGVLYVSEEFGAAVHLCACGCGSKVSTPIGPTEWTLQQSAEGPTLSPSVGSWQLPCKSHYWISGGKIVWSSQWTREQVAAGRRGEQRRRQAHYQAIDRARGGHLRRLWRWIKSFFE